MKKGKLWTPQEAQYLEENYPSKKTIEIAAHLKRSYNSVARMASKIGLIKRGKSGERYIYFSKNLFMVSIKGKRYGTHLTLQKAIIKRDSVLNRKF